MLQFLVIGTLNVKLNSFSCVLQPVRNQVLCVFVCASLHEGKEHLGSQNGNYLFYRIAWGFQVSFVPFSCHLVENGILLSAVCYMLIDLGSFWSAVLCQVVSGFVC